MSQFAAKRSASPGKTIEPIVVHSAKVLSLLMILEALRQVSMPLDA